MAKTVISNDIKNSLKNYLNNNKSAELVNTYLRFVEEQNNLEPVLFVKEKKIYASADDVVKALEQSNNLWHEAEIKITFSNQSVNAETKKIYICPFTGKVFGDNTHPNPQDAIYDWVSKCPENTERVGGLRVKRFFVSEDPGVIQSYISQQKPKEPLVKMVYSSVLSGKLFSSKEAVIKDFKKNYIKKLSLIEVQSQNKFEIDDNLLAQLQSYLQEEKIASFVEALASDEEFAPYVEQWLE